MPYDPDRADKIANLIERYRSGQFSEAVFIASLKALGVRRDNISALVSQHRAAFTQSAAYRRGDYRE